jgi:hypothetical protein
MTQFGVTVVDATDPLIIRYLLDGFRDSFTLRPTMLTWRASMLGSHR